MIESEANTVSESVSMLPDDDLRRLWESAAPISALAVLPWSEHCTECAIPDCFKTCDLYEPRIGGRCRRFVNGMERIEHGDGPVPYLTKVKFKRWAKLEAVGNCRMRSVKACRRIEAWDRLLGRVLLGLPFPYALKSFLSRKRYGWKKRWSRAQLAHASTPDYFLLEAYNPNELPINISLEIRPHDPIKAVLPFLTSIELVPGFSRSKVSGAEIVAWVSLEEEFNIALVPNDIAEGTTLYFGVMTFVCESRPQRPDPAKTQPNEGRITKCVVWDLDNTLWDGVIVENAPEGLALREGVVETIKQLDQHGILNSIASKNNFDTAMETLKRFGIDQYFVAPQISWMPKSEAVRSIARDLNIGIDTLTFVDDSQFEREEVSSVLSDVHVIDATEYQVLRSLPECRTAVTEEAANRRLLYQAQESRKSAQVGFQGDYLQFLGDCEMKMKLEPLCERMLERVHELTQRTNQMNFSGTRYKKEDLVGILCDPNLDTFVISCSDKFGDYGVVGFSVIDKRASRMVDLMFSCRIQSRRVEHAFLTFVLRRYADKAAGEFLVRYRKTERNAPSGKVFDDFHFEAFGEFDGVSELRFDLNREIPDDKLVALEVQG